MFNIFNQESKILKWTKYQFHLGAQLRFWTAIPYLAIALMSATIFWIMCSEVSNLQVISYLIFPLMIYAVFHFGLQGIGWIHAHFNQGTASPRLRSTREAPISIDLRIHVIGWIIAILIGLGLCVLIVYLLCL